MTPTVSSEDEKKKCFRRRLYSSGEAESQRNAEYVAARRLVAFGDSQSLIRLLTALARVARWFSRRQPVTQRLLYALYVKRMGSR